MASRIPSLRAPIAWNALATKCVQATGSLVAMAAAERDRWILWGPVLVAIGVCLYFALPFEPPLWAAAMPLCLAVLVAVFLRHRLLWLMLILAIAAVALGFAAAKLRTLVVAAPVLEQALGPVTVEGRVVAVEARDGGARILLADPVVSGLPLEQMPVRLRLRLARNDTAPEVGARLRLLAMLMPPAPPAMPGAYDFGRQAFFSGIGGVGYAFGRAKPAALDVPEDNRGWLDTISSGVAALRQAMDRRIMDLLPGATGAMTAALITGGQAAIPEDVMTAMRDAGLAHLLAISGFNVALVAATLFVVFRIVLALTGSWALYHPTKKWAAVATLFGVFAYTLITGASIPTVRACMMTAVVLLAVTIDRTAISLRLVMAAALALLLAAPESLLGASFQMSFAAVIALIAAYEASRGWVARQRAEGGAFRRVSLYIGGVLATTLIAGLATAPFAAFNFNRVAVYQLAANLLAVPLTAIWIMPWSLLVYLLMPFGLESIGLVPMSLGVDALIGIAETVASWPAAVVLLPSFSIAGLALVTLGGLWLCLWQRGWRLVGLPLILLGLSSFFMVRPPDLLISPEAGLFAVRGADGALVFADVDGKISGQSFLREVWQRRAGAADTVDAQAPTLRCDSLGCIYRIGDRTVALLRHADALAEDCDVADVVVSWAPLWRERCPGPELLLDRSALRDNGTHSLWLTGDQITVTTVRDDRGARPWSQAGTTR